MKKFYAALMTFILLFLTGAPAFAAEEALSEDIVILYTNDVHTYIDGPLSYDVVAALKTELKKQYKYVFLADAGDHIQGTAYGSMDNGESVIKIMNEAKYDVATLGNHEFDYGTDGCMNVLELADYPYISANFYHTENGVRGENVLDSFKSFDCGEEKLAFVGITTPETFEKSTSAYFRDENGSFIYGISGGMDGAELRNDVQNAIDEAKSQGATKVIALGHLGVDVSSQPWTSEETIAGVSGLDAFIDGHSHSVIEEKLVKDKDGNDVVLTQTGSCFDRVGIMVIDADTDAITTDFIECAENLDTDGETVTGYSLISDVYDGRELVFDNNVKESKDKLIDDINDKLGGKIGTASVVFDNYDEDGNRLVRSEETNTGDFAADALYYLFDNMGMDVDVAIMNGGGIRNAAITGDITYKMCKDIHTFGNVACLQRISGRQLLDALEWGARNAGAGENGGFLQVSGITYKVDTSVLNTVEEDENGIWLSGPEEYRVYDVEIYNKESGLYEAIDLDAEYNTAGYNYTLRNLGDGYSMFDGAVNVLDYVMEDYMVIANYIGGFENGEVGGKNSPLAKKYPTMLLDYSTVGGSGRIKFEENAGEESFEDNVWVAGVQVTKENRNDILGDGGSARYNYKTHTLTLTDATITNENGHGIHAYGTDITIIGVDTEKGGSNTIVGCGKLVGEEGEEFPTYGIYVEGNGDCNGLTLCGKLGDISSNGGNGIAAYGDIVFKGEVGNISGSSGLGSGICSDFENVIVEYSAVIGNITSDFYNGITSGGDIIISGKTGDIKGNGYVGVHAVGGDVIIDGTVGDIVGADGGIEAYSIDETGGSIAVSGRAGKIQGGSVGIYAERNVNINGVATVGATDTENDAFAIFAGESVILPTNYNIISTPEEYIVKPRYKRSNIVCYTVFTEDEPAKYIEFVGFVNPFEDVITSDWYYSDVEYAVVNGLFSGTSETSFEPNKKITRAMLASVIYRAENEPEYDGVNSYTDVDNSAYYKDAVCWAKQSGIMYGVSEEEFAPDETATREQLACTMARYAEYKGRDISPAAELSDYIDFGEISDYAKDSVSYAVGCGILSGKSKNELSPKDYTTRAEAAAILHRFLTSVI